MREIFLKTQDNVKIAINHYDYGRSTVIVICPSWEMCKDYKPFNKMSEDFFKNSDVIIMDFRGHCKSSGWYTFSAKEVNDLKAVIEYAKQKYSKIGIIGFSLGAATAIIYTAKYKDIQSLIAVSAPTDFNKIENSFYTKETFILTLRKFNLWRYLSLRPGNIFLNKVKPIDVVQNISPIPLLFIAGEKDPTIHLWHTKELYNRARKPKAIEIFQNDFHAEDLYILSHNIFMIICNNWFSKMS